MIHTGTYHSIIALACSEGILNRDPHCCCAWVLLFWLYIELYRVKLARAWTCFSYFSCSIYTAAPGIVVKLGTIYDSCVMHAHGGVLAQNLTISCTFINIVGVQECCTYYILGEAVVVAAAGCLPVRSEFQVVNNRC